MNQKVGRKSLVGDPSHPFPIGTEYYRAPMPPQEMWEEDYAAIRAAGMRIVRSFSYWNWMEPQPGKYEFDDFDRMFELAEKHDLKVWIDITLATHGSCPEWMLREYPDIRIVGVKGEVAMPFSSPASPQGKITHCYDHPKWKEYGEGLLRAAVSRYKDAPNLIMWGIWDSVSISGRNGYPCYCHNTISKYIAWLKIKFSLDELNQRFLRRYRRWEDVQPPRSNHNVVEMLLYRQFHYENLVETLRWQVEVVESIDDRHEVRAHGAHYPWQWDEACSKEVDSYGMSMPSNNLLTSDDPYSISDRCFSFDWSRSIGKNGRWWNEEIYSGMSPAGVTWKKQSDPAEITSLLWMTLVGGGAGMSMPSNNLLTSDDPYSISDRCFSFDWSRSIGKNGRWWNEEIYSGMSPAGVTWKKQSDPAEITSLLWMTLVGGGAGCMFWQYSPEYLSFEAPGYSLVAPDRSPTPRLEAVIKAISEIDLLVDHLPLEIPRADAAVVYSPMGHEIFTYGSEGERFLKDLRGVYRTLWENNIQMDVITPGMDWSDYKAIYLPNVALLDGETIEKIKGVLKNQPETNIVADGNFGSYVETGHYSYSPPEGLSELIEAGVADYSMVTKKEIMEGNNTLSTPYGNFLVTSECGYTTIRPKGSSKSIATLGEEVVGIETGDGRLKWFGLSLSAAFGDVGTPVLVLPLFESMGIVSPFKLSGDKLIVMRRKSKLGGWLIFLFNLEFKEAKTTVKLDWKVKEAEDLLEKKKISVKDNSFALTVHPGSVKVIHCNQ